MASKAQKEAQHRADLAANRVKRAELDEKIAKAKAQQAGANPVQRAKLDAAIKAFEAEKLSYPLRK